MAPIPTPAPLPDGVDDDAVVRAFAAELDALDRAELAWQVAQYGDVDGEGSLDHESLDGCGIDGHVEGGVVPAAVTAAWLVSLGTHPADLLHLAAIDASVLGPVERVHLLGALDRVDALVASLRADALVAVAGARPSGTYLDEVHAEAEVALARGSSRNAAGRAIETARALTRFFPRFKAALRAGDIDEAHCRVLVDKTRPISDPDVLAAIEARALPKAQTLPVGLFAREVVKAIADLDPDAEARYRRAREQRCVTVRPLDDGLGYLSLVHEWAVVAAIAQTLDTDAHHLRTTRGGAGAVAGGDDDARLGACRADALAARVLGTPDLAAVASSGTAAPNAADADATSTYAYGPGTSTNTNTNTGSPAATTTAGPPTSTPAPQVIPGVTFEPAQVPVTVEVVIDLATLRGEADRMALLAGEPVPAGIARDWAEAATRWRRVVTDPVTGHLLDYGTRQYLPDPLRRFVMARDGGCRGPSCGTTSPRRLQLDHALEYPDGPSSTANTGAICTTEHQLKTDGHITITDSAPDGSCTWTTTWGQTIHIPARPYLSQPEAAPDGCPAHHE